MHIKRSVLWLLMGAPMLTFAQSNYSLQVKVQHLENPGKAYLNYQEGDILRTDSATISAGAYSFKGIIQEPAMARLSILDNGNAGKDKMLFNAGIWLEKSALKLTAPNPSAEPLITGGQLNPEYRALEDSKAPDRAAMEAASKRVADATEEERKSPEFLRQHMVVMKAEMNKSAIKDSLYVIAHPNSYLSLYLISNTVSFTPALMLEQRFGALSKSLQASLLGKQLLSTINVLKNREVGGTAPEFTLTDTLNKPVSLSSFRGKFVLLDFWASWCVPCRRENPNVKAAYERFKDKNLTVVSVSIDAPGAESKWLAAIKEDQLNWVQLIDAAGGSNQAALLYNVTAIPQNFLISPSGKIVAKNLRGEELQKKLAKLLH